MSQPVAIVLTLYLHRAKAGLLVTCKYVNVEYTGKLQNSFEEISVKILEAACEAVG